MLRTQSLGFSVAGRPLLDAIDLEVPAGECLAVVGPNGAGKSTLLRLLCGELEPTCGRVYYGAQPLDAMRMLARARCRSLLPQQSSLAFDFSVREVVLMGRLPHAGGGQRPEDLAIALEALQAVDASHLADRFYPTLSGGERQRVQLARVLAQIWEPPAGGGRLLLLDEPTSALDLGHQHQVLALARRWARRDVTVVTVLHDLNLAARFADHVLVLDHGRAVALGTPSTVLTAEAIESVFGIAVHLLRHPDGGGPVIVPRMGEPEPMKQPERSDKHAHHARFVN